VVDAPDRGESTVTGGTFSLISAQAAATRSVIGPAAAAFVVIVVGAFAHGRMTGAPRMPVVARPGRNSSLISPRTRRTVSVVGAVTVLWIVGPLPFTVAISLVLLLRRLRPIRAGRRRRAAIERALPDAMDQLVSSVRAGLTPFQAVCDLARSTDPAIGDAFAEVVRRTERGQPFADALAALPQRLGAQAVGLADVIATSDRHGLPLGPVLDQLTTEIRATRRRLDQADARKLPVRLSFPLVTCTLPSFVLLAIAPAVIAALSSLGASAW
jgi:tight adherence protein C